MGSLRSAWLLVLSEISWPPLVVIKALVCAGFCAGCFETTARLHRHRPVWTELTSSSTRTDRRMGGDPQLVLGQHSSSRFAPVDRTALKL